MSDATSLLFDLPGFRVLSCALSPLGVRRVVLMQAAGEHACPRCGVLVSGRPYDCRESRIKDLPFGDGPLEVIWRKRRYRCPEDACRQKVGCSRFSSLAGQDTGVLTWGSLRTLISRSLHAGWGVGVLTGSDLF